MWVGVVTLFPEMFQAISDYGVTGRAIRENKLSLDLWNPRQFTDDRHRTVDDRPYGGGPGMIMKVEPLRRAIVAAKAKAKDKGFAPKVICLSPQGSRLNQAKVTGLANRDSMILVAGRYEGIDERLIELEVDEEISLGDFVLTGGELAAMVLIDAVSRFIPGVLGHGESAVEDSFFNGLLDCPHYTRPEDFASLRVPEVLLGGNHEEIRLWRLKQSLSRTWQRRPDLLDDIDLTNEQQRLLEKVKYELSLASLDSDKSVLAIDKKSAR
ncbi:MAG: tRNA (guanosine(37)-N1)-methyltransferase TrmD [Gammaproteobacteria bacterium]|nr:MAG: tRNA (guanosine(37)-N1)-methyltransferase TrmD [Gammaproteobacteria bacterium]